MFSEMNPQEQNDMKGCCINYIAVDNRKREVEQMDRKSPKAFLGKRLFLIMLCMCGCVLLISAIQARASAGSAQTSLHNPDAVQTAPALPVQETEEKQLQAGFAHKELPVADVGLQSNLLRLGNSKIVNILLIGQDAIKDSGSRSDSMILCTFNKKDNTITITSFLRDLYVKIPGYKSNRINAAYRFGGTELLNETLQKNFGIEVDGNIQVDFGCFEKIIDKLGGVTMELTAEEADFINTNLKESELTEGTYVLTGAQALMYARDRYDRDGDFSRTNRQRKLLNELLKTYKNKKLPEMLELIQDVLPMISTDISKADLTAYAVSLGPMLSKAEIRMQAIPVEGGYYDARIDGMAVLVPDLEKNKQFLEDTLT